MTPPTAITRHLVHRLSPILGLLLIVALFIGGAHHHNDGHQHVCAVCTAGHSPAVIELVTAPTTAPAGPALRLQALTTHAPRQARSETASSRAPPPA